MKLENVTDTVYYYDDDDYYDYPTNRSMKKSRLSSSLGAKYNKIYEHQPFGYIISRHDRKRPRRTRLRIQTTGQLDKHWQQESGYKNERDPKAIMLCHDDKEEEPTSFSSSSSSFSCFSIQNSNSNSHYSGSFLYHKKLKMSGQMNENLRKKFSLRPKVSLNKQEVRNSSLSHHSLKTTTTTTSLLLSSSSWSRFSDLKLVSLLIILALPILSIVTILPDQAEAIKLQPDGKEKHHWSGDSLVVFCQNNNNVKNVKIRWIGPSGNEISDQTTAPIHMVSKGQSGSMLVFMHANLSKDAGQYKCQIGSSGDQSPREQIDFNLRLYNPPNFKDTQRSYKLPVDTRGVLTCKVELDPSVAYHSVSWNKDSVPLDKLENYSSYQVVEYSPSTQESQLIISKVKREHAGNYSCQAYVLTQQLPKSVSLDIELDVLFGPHFDEENEIVWVERGQSIANRQRVSGTVYSAHGSHGPNHGKLLTTSGQNRMRSSQRKITDPSESSSQLINNNSTIRVDLVCRTEANPPAKIVWTYNRDKKDIILQKGFMSHIIEEPVQEIIDKITISKLTIEYNLNPNWEHTQDQYACHASNTLGSAIKRLTIEQGDPAPAFNVALKRHYDPQSSMFSFILLGPAGHQSIQNLEQSQIEQTSSLASQQTNIVNSPPVDSFRIRTGSDSGHDSATSNNNNNYNSNYYYYHKNQAPVSVELSPKHPKQAHITYPQNVTVSLAKLPAGQQKLYLEAHNAVGWSPYNTYLGEYNLVSGSTSFAKPSLSHVQLAAISFALSIILSCHLIFEHGIIGIKSR